MKLGRVISSVYMIPETLRSPIRSLMEKRQPIRAFQVFPRRYLTEVVNRDAMKTKQLEKGLLQLMEEGVAQLFTFELGKRKVVGVVGALQFEVIQFRLKKRI